MKVLPTKTEKNNAMKFKVAIKVPELWKIRAIAALKARREKRSVDTSSVKNRSINSNMNNVSISKKTGDTTTTGSAKGPTDVKENSSLSRPTLVERSVKELEYWNNRSLVAKERIASLHSVKNSLLWLLKKAAVHERSLINDHPPIPHN